MSDKPDEPAAAPPAGAAGNRRPAARPTDRPSAADRPSTTDQGADEPAQELEFEFQAAVRELTPEEQELRRQARARRRRRKLLAQRRRRIRRVSIALGVVMLLLTVTTFVWIRYTFGGLDRIPGELPAAANTPGTTILLVGSDPGAHDALAEEPAWRASLGRSDLVMLMHVPEGGGSLYSVSIPHDARFQIPGQGSGRLVDAYSAGKQGLYVKAVQDLTGVRVDHLAVIDLNGLREVADEVGGIDVRVPTAACDDVVGPRRMDGESALVFMRLRPCLPNGDLDRVARQQAVLKAVLAAALDGNSLANPFRLNRLAKSTFDHMAVEEGWGLLGMARLGWSLRNIGPARTTFLTVPTVKTQRKRVLRLDEPRAAELWDALRRDRMAEYVQLNRIG